MAAVPVTSCFRTDVLAEKFVPPPNTALIEWLPAASFVVANEPRQRSTVWWPRTSVPSQKLTGAPGVTAPGGLARTVAVKVTVCPTTEGFGEATNVVVVAPR